jgi:DNA polymerase III delta prime subunit
MSEEKKNNIPWVEKYRPTHFENIVLDPVNRELFEKIIQKNEFPNLLFYGPPGTGKTTTIINLIQEYQRAYSKINKGNVIHLNASDERGIDIIRNQIYSFVRSKNLFETGFKFVILDEVDYMTKNAQQALKYLLQTTTTNVRFCLICNYISKIDEPLKNEFISVRFNQLPQKDIIQFIETIIKKEDIKIAKNDIYTIQSMYKSDIRSMINFLQLNQNFKLNEWKKNILNPEVLDKLHNMFYTKLKQDDIINEIYNISRHYNIDKKHLIHCYLNHIVRLKLIPITENTIDIIKKTVHSVNADMEDVIIYLIESLKTIDFKPFPYVSVSSA